MGKSKSVIVLVAGLIGVIQSLAWIGMSLAVIILTYSHSADDNCIVFTSRETIGCNIYFGYIRNLDDVNVITDEDKRIVKNSNFVIFAYIHLVLNVVWFLISSVLIGGVIKGNNKSGKYRNGLWSGITILLSIFDVILISLLAHDYHLQIDVLGEIIIGIMMTIAARGYVLWIVNIVFASILGKSSYNHFNKAPINNRPYINAFDTSNRPPWEVETFGSLHNTNNNGEFNKGFKNDNDDLYKSGFFGTNYQTNNNNQSFESSLKRNNGANPIANNNNQNWQPNRTNQEVNRPYSFGERSSPPRMLNNFSQTPKPCFPVGQRPFGFPGHTPFIPDPDYSPPGSPRVKGVLRPSSNYVL